MFTAIIVWLVLSAVLSLGYLLGHGLGYRKGIDDSFTSRPTVRKNNGESYCN